MSCSSVSVVKMDFERKLYRHGSWKALRRALYVLYKNNDQYKLLINQILSLWIISDRCGMGERSGTHPGDDRRSSRHNLRVRRRDVGSRRSNQLPADIGAGARWSVIVNAFYYRIEAFFLGRNHSLYFYLWLFVKRLFVVWLGHSFV